MDTETAANPADAGPVTLVDAVEAANAGNQAAQTEANAPAGDGEDSIDALTKEALGETQATPEDLIEIEYEGEKQKLPPKWKDAFLREQDYRRKTMDLAENRKAFEAEREQFQQTVTRSREEQQAYGKLLALDMRIQELERVDITGWSQQDINDAVANLNALKAQAGQIAGALQQHVTQRTQAESEQLAKLREATLSEAAARVPNFTEDRRKELEALAVSVGVDKRDAESITDPAAYELLHYADIGKKFIERQRKAAQMKSAQAGNPATMLGSAAGGNKAPEDMSMEEYAKWREAGNG